MTPDGYSNQHGGTDVNKGNYIGNYKTQYKYVFPLNWFKKQLYKIIIKKL